jgi:hypothetical protein
MALDHFVQNVVLVPKGSKLLVVNDSSVEHILQNGAWDASGTPHAGAVPGAPTLRNVAITGGSRGSGHFPSLASTTSIVRFTRA